MLKLEVIIPSWLTISLNEARNMKKPKWHLLGISILIFIVTSKAHNRVNLISALNSEIREQRPRVLNVEQSTSVYMQNCNRNYDDAKAYKCSVSNPL